MALRKQTFVPGEYYHLYNRGTEKRIIFLDEQDYHHFLFLMYICNTEKSITLRSIGNGEFFERGETIIDIGSFCLMPNYFHKKYKRTGKLYEGVFKSIHANKDTYLKYLYSYMRLNPAKLIDSKWKEKRNKTVTELLEYVFKYPYSSLKEYESEKFKILNPAVFPVYFKNPIDHKKELFEWLDIENT